ncbi:MAG TPA: aldehyde dehydrogenase family protein, partial [Ginsengibacter sp.]
MDFLKRLNILKENKGVSTGTKWMPLAETWLMSSSPVDGQNIAVVNICDSNNYERVIRTAQ